MWAKSPMLLSGRAAFCLTTPLVVLCGWGGAVSLIFPHAPSTTPMSSLSWTFPQVGEGFEHGQLPRSESANEIHVLTWVNVVNPTTPWR